MFEDIFSAPIAYDLGIPITTVRKRKPNHKGTNNTRHKNIVTIVMSSKEVSEVGAQVLMKAFNKLQYT